MIPLETFLRCIRENAERVKEYEKGHDGSDGKCDCIGLIMRAVELAGARWPGDHGSNWAERSAMNGAGVIGSEDDLYLGEIVYKYRAPGETGYDLPERYKTSGDLRDYYHVGVVTGLDPLNITHCTKVPGGIAHDLKMGNWRWGGKLKYVDYEEEEPMEEIRATVFAESGKTVNMRAKPDIKSTIIARVPVGEEVIIFHSPTDNDTQWGKTEWGGKVGYMMAQFLRIEADEQEEPGEDTVNVNRADLETWADVLEEMARDIRGALGQG